MHLLISTRVHFWFYSFGSIGEFDICTSLSKLWLESFLIVRCILCVMKGEVVIEHISAAGEDVASKSSDTMPDGHNSRHHLLRQKLTLDAGTPSDRALTQSEVGKQKSKRRASSKHLSCKHMCNVTHLTCVGTGNTHLALMSVLIFVKLTVRARLRVLCLRWTTLGWVMS